MLKLRYKKALFLLFLSIILLTIFINKKEKSLVYDIANFTDKGNNWIVDYEYDNSRYHKKHINYLYLTYIGDEINLNLNDIKFEISNRDVKVYGIIGNTSYEEKINSKNNKVIKILIGSVKDKTYKSDKFLFKIIGLNESKGINDKLILKNRN